MKILQILHDRLPERVGGIEVYVDRLARRLSEEHEVALLCSAIGGATPNHSLRQA